MPRAVPSFIARVVFVALFVVLLAWCGWWGTRAGAARLFSNYALGANESAAADLASRLAPDDPEAHYARARLLADAGDYEIAASVYERALALRPADYVLWLELGKARDGAGDAAGAVEALREAARLAPFYAQPRWQLGNVLLRAGRGGEALDELRRAAESDPTLYPKLVQAVWYSSGARDARLLVETARPRGAEESLVLAKFLVKVGAAGEALRLFRESGREMTDEARRALVNELINAESYNEAYAVWRGAKVAPNDKGVLSNDGKETLTDGEKSSSTEGAKGLLTDGGFEQTLRTDERGFGWQFARELPTVKSSLDADAPREGARSLRLDFSGDSDPDARLLSQLVLVERGARYRLRFALRARELVTGGPLLLRVSEPKGSYDGAQLASTPPLPTDTSQTWRDFTLDFTVPTTSDAVRLTLQRQYCAGIPTCPIFGIAWIDAFELKKL